MRNILFCNARRKKKEVSLCTYLHISSSFLESRKKILVQVQLKCINTFTTNRSNSTYLFFLRFLNLLSLNFPPFLHVCSIPCSLYNMHEQERSSITNDEIYERYRTISGKVVLSLYLCFPIACTPTHTRAHARWIRCPHA